MAGESPDPEALPSPPPSPTPPISQPDHHSAHPDHHPSHPITPSSPSTHDHPAGNPQGSSPLFVLKTFISGGVAGMCAKTATAPLDRLKILLQVHHDTYRGYGVFKGFSAIYRNEGYLGYYKGNGAMMVRVFPYAAIQFMSYEQYKRLLRPYFSQNTHSSKLLAGSLTGVTAVTFTYPLDVVRARMAYQVHERRYRSILQTLMTIPREEGGLIALYRGYASSILGMIPYAGAAFYSYEVVKSFLMNSIFLKQYATKESLDGSGTIVLNIPANLFTGGLAGALSQCISYPMDVCRRHMQLEGMRSQNPQYRNPFSLLLHIYRTAGITSGLYRGMTINFYRAVPQVAVSFSVYELMKQVFGISKPV